MIGILEGSQFSGGLNEVDIVCEDDRVSGVSIAGTDSRWA